eukprot:Gb_31177 [translate_table: standard]
MVQIVEVTLDIPPKEPGDTAPFAGGAECILFQNIVQGDDTSHLLVNCYSGRSELEGFFPHLIDDKTDHAGRLSGVELSTAGSCPIICSGFVGPPSPNEEEQEQHSMVVLILLPPDSSTTTTMVVAANRDPPFQKVTGPGQPVRSNHFNSPFLACYGPSSLSTSNKDEGLSPIIRAGYERRIIYDPLGGTPILGTDLAPKIYDVIDSFFSWSSVPTGIMNRLLLWDTIRETTRIHRLSKHGWLHLPDKNEEGDTAARKARRHSDAVVSLGWRGSQRNVHAISSNGGSLGKIGSIGKVRCLRREGLSGRGSMGLKAKSPSWLKLHMAQQASSSNSFVYQDPATIVSSRLAFFGARESIMRPLECGLSLAQAEETPSNRNSKIGALRSFRSSLLAQPYIGMEERGVGQVGHPRCWHCSVIYARPFDNVGTLRGKALNSILPLSMFGKGVLQLNSNHVQVVDHWRSLRETVTVLVLGARASPARSCSGNFSFFLHLFPIGSAKGPILVPPQQFILPRKWTLEKVDISQRAYKLCCSGYRIDLLIKSWRLRTEGAAMPLLSPCVTLGDLFQQLRETPGFESGNKIENLNVSRSCSLSGGASSTLLLDTLRLPLGKKKVAPKKGKIGMDQQVFVVLAKRKSFAWRIKWERIPLSKLPPCLSTPPIVDGSATPGATKLLGTTTGSKWICFSYPPPVASLFIPFFPSTVVEPDRPDFPKWPPPALPGIESREHLRGLAPLGSTRARHRKGLRSLWGGQMVWPSDSLLSRKARWEDLTVVSYMDCLADQMPYIKMSFSVSSPVRWVIGPMLSPHDLSPHLETRSRLAPEEGGGYHNQGRANTRSGHFTVLRTPTELLAHALVLAFITEQEWTYRTEIISRIDILIHQFPIIINGVNGYSVRPWEEPTEGDSIHQRRLQVLSKLCWIVTDHMALQPNLYCGPHCEGDKVKALDPSQAPMCTCSSPPIKQRCYSIRSNNILSEIGECLSLPHFLYITQVLSPCPPLFSPTLHVTLPAYGSNFPSCASRSFVISPTKIERAFPSLHLGKIRRLLPIPSRSANKCFDREYIFSFSSLVLQVLLFCSRPAPTQAIKAFSRLNQSLGCTFPEHSEGKAWAMLSSRACVLGSFCIIGPLELLVYGLGAFPYIASYNWVESLGTFIHKMEKGLLELGKWLQLGGYPWIKVFHEVSPFNDDLISKGWHKVGLKAAPSLPLHSCAFPSRGPEATTAQCASSYPFPECSEGKAPSKKLISFWEVVISFPPRARFGIPHLAFMISTFNCAPETWSKHARRAQCAPFTTCSGPPGGVFHRCATPRTMGHLPNHHLCPTLPSLRAPWLGLRTIPIMAQHWGSMSFSTPGGDRTRHYGVGFFIVLAKVPVA